jgi:hypothetical protein
MLTDPQAWASLLTLTALEVVLSIDNLVVIAILVCTLPQADQARARYIGMTLALLPRLVHWHVRYPAQLSGGDCRARRSAEPAPGGGERRHR